MNKLVSVIGDVIIKAILLKDELLRKGFPPVEIPESFC